jgi:hypothetical protein
MDMPRARILLVEDDPDDVWIMRGLLGDRWDGPFDLVHAEMLAFCGGRPPADDVTIVLVKAV